MKKALITLAAWAVFISGFAQISQNERLTYTGAYRMGGMMTTLAQVSLQTNPVKTSKKTYLHLCMEAQTFSKWDYFFKIRDLYESYVDPATLRPSLYKRNILEGKYSKMEKYIYRGNTISSTSDTKSGALRTKTVSVHGGSMDVVAAMYKLRSVDFSKMRPGQVFAVTVIFDEKEYPASARFMGKETVSAGCLGKRECYKLSIAARTNKLRGKDQNVIWFTADSRKIPALIKFSIPVGVGQLVLTSVH